MMIGKDGVGQERRASRTPPTVASNRGGRRRSLSGLIVLLPALMMISFASSDPAALQFKPSSKPPSTRSSCGR